LAHASGGARVVTPAGMVLDGSRDAIEAPATADPTADPDGDGVTNEVPESLVDYMEFYLLNYFRPATYQQTKQTTRGRRVFARLGCPACHVPDLEIEHDRRVADVDTRYDRTDGISNNLFAPATPLHDTVDDQSGLPPLKPPQGGRFVVQDIFTDLKRHDLGPAFHERNYDGSVRTEFMTFPLWAVDRPAPHGHHGPGMHLREGLS